MPIAAFATLAVLTLSPATPAPRHSPATGHAALRGRGRRGAARTAGRGREHMRERGGEQVELRQP